MADGFRQPSSPYGPGNRGIEYDIGPGTPINAVDDGRVVFVGSIGGSNFVVVDHGEGLKSTYAYVESALVVRGQHVKRGERLAIGGPGFHLTARLWGEYVDPALLFGGAEVEVRLIEGHGVSRSTDTHQVRSAQVAIVGNWEPFGGLLKVPNPQKLPIH